MKPSKAESETLAVFLLHPQLHLHQSKPGRAKHSTNMKQGKGKKQILIGLRVLGSSK
jgi:hypothetical protein